MLLLAAAPASGRLALLLTLAWLGAASGCAPGPRSYRPRSAARRLLYRLGALYIGLFGFGHNAHPAPVEFSMLKAGS